MELRGFFIIPLTSWIRAAIITSMNIHEVGIYESTRETDKQKQMEGERHKQYFANKQSKSKYYANIKSQRQPNTGTPHCYLAKYGTHRLVSKLKENLEVQLNVEYINSPPSHCER